MSVQLLRDKGCSTELGNGLRDNTKAFVGSDSFLLFDRRLLRFLVREGENMNTCIQTFSVFIVLKHGGL